MSALTATCTRSSMSCDVEATLPHPHNARVTGLARRFVYETLRAAASTVLDGTASNGGRA